MVRLLLRTESSAGSRSRPVCWSHSLQAGLPLILQCSCSYYIVPVARDSVWQAFTSVPKICKSYWHESGSSLKPVGCELHRAISSCLDGLLEVLASSSVCSNSQFVRPCSWTSRRGTEIPLSILYHSDCSPNLFHCLQHYVESLNAFFFLNSAFEISMTRTRPGGLAVHIRHLDSSCHRAFQLHPLSVMSTHSYFLFCWPMRSYFTFQQASKKFLEKQK